MYVYIYVNRTPRFVYCFLSELFPTLTGIEIWDIDVVLKTVQKSNKKFSASLYQIHITDTGRDFSLYFSYE